MEQKKVKPEIIEKKTYNIECPNCRSYYYDITHLEELKMVSFGTWYCHNCGGGISGIKVDGEWTITYGKERKKNNLNLLKLIPLEDPIYVVVKGMDFFPDKRTPKEIVSGKRYFYEEHQCPTNITGDIVELFYGDDEDYHGLFEYLGTADIMDDEELRNLNLEDVFKMFGHKEKED